MDELENLQHLFDSQKKDLLHLVQARSKPLGPEEVHYFLTSMDKICSHGLKNEKLGYWPFVQEFTHKAGASYIADMTNCATGPGKGRAWLLLALSENMLEFYFTSFVSHAAQRARHYRPGAFLRDEPRLKELVLGLAELMAADLSTVLRPEEYDLDKHVCPPPSTSEVDGEFPSSAISPSWPPTDHEPLHWTHTGGRTRARRSRHSSPDSSTATTRSSRSSARSRRRRGSTGAGGRSPDEAKDVRRDSDAAPTDSACVTMESDQSGVSALSSTVTTPASERVTTPASEQVTTSASEQVTTPACERATTPASERVTTPTSERAASTEFAAETQESAESPESAEAPESAESAGSAEIADSANSESHGESGEADVSSVDGVSHEQQQQQREEEEEAVVGSATPTAAVISASSPVLPTAVTRPVFAAQSDDVPSPIVAAPSPSETPNDRTASGRPLELSPVPMSPLGGVSSCSQSSEADLFVTALDVTQATEESQSSRVLESSLTGDVEEAVPRGAPSGGCTPSEETSARAEAVTGRESASADMRQSGPSQDEAATSGDDRLSQPASSNPSETLNSTTSETREDDSSVTSESISAQEDTRAPSKPSNGLPTAETAQLKNRALSPTADSRRVNSSDTLAVEEAMRRLRTDPAGPSRPPPTPTPHLHPSASSVALRPRAAAARLATTRSEVTLRRSAPPLAPHKRVTWAGTDRETAAVAALLSPEPPRGERGAPEGQEDSARLSSVSSLTRVSSQLSVGSSCLSSAGSERVVTARPATRQTRLYEPAALGSPPPSSDGQTEREIEQELSQGRRRKRAAYSALVEIGHCKAVQLMVSFFEGDEMAYTGFKVLFGDHHAMRTCLLVLTSYRLLLLRLSTYRRLRRAARRRPRACDPLSQLSSESQTIEQEKQEQERESCPYLQDAAYQYCTIASIKVAFHGQAIALQRPDGSYSRWIWLGDRAETALLISHVTRAFERCRLRPLVPQVYTSEAHRQQYVREIGYRETEPDIQYASLVYFEDFAVPGETPKLSSQLMYKTDTDERWSVGYFVLWDADLLVYPSAAALRAGGAPLDRWPLPAMTACRRLTQLCRPHQLQLAAPGRWLTLAAADADTCTLWAATVREIMELSVPSQLPSPRPRCCVLTGCSLYIVEEMAFNRSLTPGFELFPYGHLVQANGVLTALGAVNADSHGTVHLEFDTAEAAESMGSWRLYFVTLPEQRAFLAALLDTYRKLCKAELTVGQISHHMREVCLSGSRYVRTRWDGLIDT